MASVDQTLEAIPKRKFEAGEFIIFKYKKPNGIYSQTHGTVDAIIDVQKITQINQMGAIFLEIV